MNANFIQTLMYYDGPQIVLLSLGKTGANIVGVAIEKEGMDYPFFACAVKKRDWQRYIDGKVDLFYLFKNPAGGRRYFFDLNKITDDSRVSLQQAKGNENFDNAYWPERGVFSTCHTEELQHGRTQENDVQVFNIDGTWEAMDFSGFYSKISDIYAIFLLRDMFKNKTHADKILSKVKSGVKARFWQGGGSYKGFYHALSHSMPFMSPLRVSRIQYASPGQIELRGREDIFVEMILSLSCFEETNREAAESSRNKVGVVSNKDELVESPPEKYRYIDNILSKEKLKTAKPDTKFSSGVIKESVKNKAASLLSDVGVQDTDTFFSKICDENVLIFAKLTLSIYRRFKGVNDFISEGRVEAAPNSAIATNTQPLTTA
ncbi:MAG: hypothetical protein HQL45_01105 [Alphaproteobacteria bacterium]|nr:hypothetical protein [Alphaproteobacteria bacterium]